MAAHKNIKERERILLVAIDKFIENGYNQTSYQDIASICNIGKSKIQYYFPKKDLFIAAFLERHLEAVSSCMKKYMDDSDDMLSRMYYLGYFHFDFLINNQRMSMLTRDIVASRELTKTVLHMEIAWVKMHFSEGKIRDITDNMIIALGGAYELLYQYQCDNREITSQYIEEKALMVFALSLGMKRSEVQKRIKMCHNNIKCFIDMQESLFNFY